MPRERSPDHGAQQAYRVGSAAVNTQPLQVQPGPAEQELAVAR